MTGFARCESQGSWGTLVCELRSVNHRFLEVSFRLPDELRSAEGELRTRLARGIRRGKVDCSFSWRRLQGAQAPLEIDTHALERLLARLADLSSRLPGAPQLDPLDVLRWPGVLREESAGTEELQASALTVFDATVAALGEAREREGARLRELLVQRCDGLETIVVQVRTRIPEVLARARTRLTEKVAELGATVNPERLEQELALLLQRLDVDEELDRLTGHIAEVRRVVDGRESAGRRLDFLMQELNREANTLSSKSQDLDTTRSAVDMKVLIEQLREQVQNVE